ncbi:NfeD family protein [Roseivirga sp.]|uniref:NfeD family protein n=1 Tax=Roseivirga sp. TaxID=1964215 RepID=UPI003B8D0A24
MADWIYIVLLILIGLILVIVELIFIPGTTIFGILGALLVAVGVFFTYENYGNTIGTYVFIGSALTGGGLLIYGLKAKTWKKFALTSQIDSKVKEGYTDILRENMTGLAMSDLKPIGKVEFEGKAYEVTSQDGLIDSGSEVRITRINRNKIIVKLA